MSRRLPLLFSLGLLLAVCPPLTGADGPELSGWVRSHTGLLLQEQADYAVVQNAFSLSFEGGGERMAFKLNPFARLDLDRSLEIGLREAYLDLYFDSLQLRIGQQQIIWGKGEGVFITDVVAPKDLRNFILPEFSEIRLGIPALRADYYLGGSSFTVVLVPLFVPTRTPEPGSIWHVIPEYPVTPTLHPAQEPEAALENGEIFARWSWLGPALDFELMGGLMWDDEAALHLTRTIDGGVVTALDVQPRYHRLAVAGGGFSAAFAGMVLRAEGAYYHGKRFATAALSDADGLVEKDYLHYLAGLDFGLAGLDLSLQFVQRAILDYAEPVSQDRFDNTITLRVSDNLLRDTLRLELFAYVGLNAPDALLRPKLTWAAADGLEISAGADVLLGKEGTFGRYDANDQVYLKAKASF